MDEDEEAKKMLNKALEIREGIPGDGYPTKEIIREYIGWLEEAIREKELSISEKV